MGAICGYFVLVDAPACIAAAIGLWKMRQWGYVAAQFVAGVFVYASGEIFVHLAEGGPPYALEMLIPQVAAVLVAGALVFYLWQVRGRFP